MGRITRKGALSNANDTAKTRTLPKAKQERPVNKKNNKQPRKSNRKSSLLPQTELEELINSEGDKRHFFYGYDDELAYLDQLVRTLLAQNKANSVIICADTGFGKNSLVDACLSRYPVVRGNPDPEFDHLNVVLFRFDGNLHGRNELATLRQIGRRLNQFLEKARQVTVEDEPDMDLDDDDLAGKLANSIPQIIAQFHYLADHCPNFRCIIILDNLEVFSYRQQYLLYNLFDLIQKGQSVLIMGLTRRLDCIQLLTSRVQSRLNRRMIHLVAPFKSQESYSKFCLDYCKILLPNHYQNIDKDSFQEEITKSFAFNRSFDELKRLIQSHSFVPQKGPSQANEEPKSGTNKQSIFLHEDPKVVDLANLTKNELVLLILATKQLRILDEDTFTCRQLHEWSSRVTHVKTLRFDHIVQFIYKLIEYDLVIVAKESRSHSNKAAQLSISPWTTLMLNISEFQIKELLEKMGNKIPSYLLQLLN